MRPEHWTTTAEPRTVRRPATLVRGDSTDGRVAVVELEAVGGMEPPRHLHANEDELLYVLEGELTVYIGEEVRRAAAGSCLFFSRGTEHGYAVESETARLLIVLTPAGLEEFLEETGASLHLEGIEHLIALAARYGIAITGPRPSAGGCGR